MDVYVIKSLIAGRTRPPAPRRMHSPYGFERFTTSDSTNTTSTSTSTATGSADVTLSEDETKTIVVGGLITGSLIVLSLLLFGVPAAYISWASNTLVGWHAVFKVIFSFLAFCNGFLYLLLFLFHRLDMFLYIKTSGCGRAPAPAPSAT
jgi:hypothetical protein